MITKIKYSLLFLVLVYASCTSYKPLYEDVAKKIQIKCNIYGDTLNTFENYYYGNNSGPSDNRVSFFLSLDEQNEIIEVVNTFKFFELPDNLVRFKWKPNEQDSIWFLGSLHSQFCTIEINGRRKSVLMSSVRNFDTEESIKFEKIVDVIYNIIEKRKDLEKFHSGMWWI